MYETEEVKNFIYPNACGNNDAMTAAMMSNGGMNGMWNNPIWAIVFLAALRNGGIFGNDGNGNAQLSQIQDTLNTNQGNTLLMDAIKGNQNAIGELASTIGCNFNSVNCAINTVQSAICNVSNQVGMTSMQTINAIQSGNMQLANTLQNCCCDIRESVTRMGYDNQLNNQAQSTMIERGFSGVNYNLADQMCQTRQAAKDNTMTILAKLDQIEDSRKDREIAALAAQNASLLARAERQAELAPVLADLADIKCKQPNVVTTQYSPFVAVPNCVAYQNGYFGNGYGLGNWA